MPLLFNKRSRIALSAFVRNYQEFLFALYQYQILSNLMKEDADRFRWSLEQAKRELNEDSHRKELVGKFKLLQKSYGKLLSKKVEKRVNEQIRLKLF